MTQYVRMNNYESIELDTEWIILNTDEYTLTKLNGVGGFCWSLLGNAQTIDTIADAVRNEFQSVHSDVETDVEVFLHDMMNRGLVQLAGA